jgi:hypothetical protein
MPSAQPFFVNIQSGDCIVRTVSLSINNDCDTNEPSDRLINWGSHSQIQYDLLQKKKTTARKRPFSVLVYRANGVQLRIFSFARKFDSEIQRYGCIRYSDLPISPAPRLLEDRYSVIYKSRAQLQETQQLIHVPFNRND